MIAIPSNTEEIYGGNLAEKGEASTPSSCSSSSFSNRSQLHSPTTTIESENETGPLYQTEKINSRLIRLFRRGSMERYRAAKTTSYGPGKQDSFTSRSSRTEEDSHHFQEASYSSTRRAEENCFQSLRLTGSLAPHESAKQKSLRFDPTKTQIFPVLLRSEFTEEERVATWIQEHEYQRITTSCCKQIKKLEQGKSLLDKKYCARGLETHTRWAAETKSITRRAAFDAVLEEQARQFDEGVLEEDLIAEVYTDVASSCQLWANRIALVDQRNAEEIRDDDF